MPDFFISYDRDDSAFVNHLCQFLHEQGFTFWWDVTGLRPGTADWQLKIEEAIEKARALIVILSPNSKASKWVRMEVRYAEMLEKQIIPVLVTGDERTSVPIDFVNVQWLDWRGGTPAQDARLSSELRRIVDALTRRFHIEMIVKGLAYLRQHRVQYHDIGVTTAYCHYWGKTQIVVGYRVRFRVTGGSLPAAGVRVHTPKPFTPEHDAYLRDKGWEGRVVFPEFPNSYDYWRTWQLWSYGVEAFPRDLTPEMTVVAEALLELHERFGLDAERALFSNLAYLWPPWAELLKEKRDSHH